MTNINKAMNLSRRSVLRAGGAFVVSIGMPVGFDTVLGINASFAQGARPPLVPSELASYIAVNADGTISAFFGKMDMGQGLFVAIAQMVAEELDVPFAAVKVIMGDTATSVNQGGASGSTGIQFGGKQMRAAAAEARRVLVEMAAQKLALPADQLTVTDGVVHAKSDIPKKASYAELIGGRYFNVQLDWNKEIGNALYAPGKAQPKRPSDHKIVGRPIKRQDVAPKVFCEQDFVTDIKVPGMVHGRIIRPAVAGALPIKVDESSIKDIPGVKAIIAFVAPQSLQNGKDPFVFQGLNPGGPEGAFSYTIPNLLIDHAMRNPHIPPHFWRGVNNNQNALYLECFMDELAHAAGEDPLEFRRKLMANHSKHLAVLNAVAERAGWGKPAPQGVFRGLSQHMGYGSYVAACAEVSVSANGGVKIHRIVAATDPGHAVNPAQIERQIAGSFVYGLSALFYQECTVRTAASNKRTLIVTTRCASTRCRRSSRSSCRPVVSGAVWASRRFSWPRLPYSTPSSLRPASASGRSH